eukprot:4406256-Prymnesium_polylepis.3
MPISPLEPGRGVQSCCNPHLRGDGNGTLDSGRPSCARPYGYRAQRWLLPIAAFGKSTVESAGEVMAPWSARRTVVVRARPATFAATSSLPEHARPSADELPAKRRVGGEAKTTVGGRIRAAARLTRVANRVGVTRDHAARAANPKDSPGVARSHTK